MNIELKPNNEPKQPGYYLCRRSGEWASMELARVIREESGRLYMFHGIGCFPLKDCGPALWSDKFAVIGDAKVQKD